MRRVSRALSHIPEATRTLIATAAALAIPVSVAGALVSVRSHTTNATVALALAALVSLLASFGTRATAAVAAISASIGFDVFHTRPYGSLAITGAEDVQTTLLLLVVGLLVGQLAARNRRHRNDAADSSYDLARIHGVAEMVAAGHPSDQVILAVSNELTDLLGLRRCRFDPSFANRPGPFIERHGEVSWGALRWGFRSMGLPHEETSLVLQHQGRPLGRYVLIPEPGRRVTSDQLIAAVALADQAAAALAHSSRHS